MEEYSNPPVRRSPWHVYPQGWQANQWLIPYIGENAAILHGHTDSQDHSLCGPVLFCCANSQELYLEAFPDSNEAQASWELTQAEGIAPHDCLGSNLHLHLRGNRVMRVHPRDNEAVNETWISDRDRYSYAGLNGPDRLGTPLIKRDGVWVEVDWSAALALYLWMVSTSSFMPAIYLSSSIMSMLAVFLPAGESTPVTSTMTSPAPPLARAS